MSKIRKGSRKLSKGCRKGSHKVIRRSKSRKGSRKLVKRNSRKKSKKVCRTQLGGKDRDDENRNKNKKSKGKSAAWLTNTKNPPPDEDRLDPIGKIIGLA
ncbi:MAG: hypothetical protein WD512_03275 [Candidatus Paceibacterota bacterium]